MLATLLKMFLRKFLFPKHKIFLIISIATNGVLLGLTLYLYFSSLIPPNPDTFDYISPRVLVSNKNDTIINLLPLREALNDYVHNKTTSKVGVYFEYLPSGNSIGVNEKDQYRVSSLVKVPNAMAIYKKIEQGKLKLDQEVEIQSEDLDKKFGDLWRKGAGSKISVKEALNLSLVESDNTANNVLLSLLSDKDLIDIYDSLDIPVEGEGDVFLISPKNYSSVFRNLYLASYLDQKYSNEVLEILTKSTFTDELARYIPRDIKIAHKIGEFVTSKDNIHHDCGIVYVPKRPYMLCLMVQGNSNDNSIQDYISAVSKLVFDYISNVKSDN